MTPLTWIIPTYDNPRQLAHTLNGLIEHTWEPGKEFKEQGFKVIVVNNGSALSLTPHPLYRIINAGTNLGWEGGLVRGIQECDTPYVGFLNDDIQIVPGNPGWCARMAKELDDHPEAGAAGPMSNFVMGWQRMDSGLHPAPYDTNLLIGFCMIVRREALDKAGGVHPGLPGGDDFDLSIRMRKEGYKLLLCADTFVYHHGSQTGQRLHAGYWSSPQMVQDTRDALIRKHSLRDYLDCVQFTPRIWVAIA